MSNMQPNNPWGHLFSITQFRERPKLFDPAYDTAFWSNGTDMDISILIQDSSQPAPSWATHVVIIYSR